MVFSDLKDEIQQLFKGKTLDALVPPFVYVVTTQFLSLPFAVVSALLASLMIGLIRMRTKGSLKYLGLGIAGVLFASAIALFSENASNFYLPKLLTSATLATLCLLSLMIKKPLAAWLSHLSRGWQIDWFWRSDIRPAYSEVTLMWFLLIALRGVLQAVLLIRQDIEGLFIINTLLGTPLTITVLAASYIYGIWRLKKLGGPSVDEHNQNAPKPWKGQTKGF